MSELVEKVARYIGKQLELGRPDLDARAAIKAIAEWLDTHQSYPEKLIAKQLLAQLEDKP